MSETSTPCRHQITPENYGAVCPGCGRRIPDLAAATGPDALVSAGGWCAPSDFLFKASPLMDDLIDFPRVSVARGGIDFTPPTPTERAHVARIIERVTAWREAVIADACRIAAAHGWDVHLWPHHETTWRTARDSAEAHTLHRIGIEFRPARYPIPTVVEHEPYDATWDYDDDEWSTP